jgi:hypothetical protein
MELFSISCLKQLPRLCSHLGVLFKAILLQGLPRLGADIDGWELFVGLIKQAILSLSLTESSTEIISLRRFSCWALFWTYLSASSSRAFCSVWSTLRCDPLRLRGWLRERCRLISLFRGSWRGCFKGFSLGGRSWAQIYPARLIDRWLFLPMFRLTQCFGVECNTIFWKQGIRLYPPIWRVHSKE